MISALLRTKNLAFWALLAVSAAATLPGLYFPPEVVFDEVHFGKFVTAYCCSGERIFDIHPPHGKLLIAAGAYAGGYRGGFDFDHIGKPYGEAPVAALRGVSAVMGAALPLIIYGLARQFGAAAPLAALAGLALVFDNALTVQSRLIALDTLLLAATFASLSVFFLALARPREGERLLLLLVAGAFAGLSAGTKFTGLTALALIGLITGARLLQVLWKQRYLGRISVSGKRQIIFWLNAGVLVLLGAVVVYLLGWWIHFALLTQPGSGDVWGLPSGNFGRDLDTVHRTMLSANYHLTATHPYSSQWWSWPLMMRPIFYWQGEAADGRLPPMIYFIGNPVVWWGACILFITALGTTLFRFHMSVFRKDRFRRESVAGKKDTYGIRPQPWMLLAGYVISYAPFMNVPRALFLYHYLPPLIFALVYGIVWLAGKGDGGLRGWNQPRWYWLVLLMIVAGFVFFSPLTYGFAVPDWVSLLFLFRSWR